jgi:hypothetical protein
MRKFTFFCGLLAFACSTGAANAGLVASAEITAKADGSNFDYSITLTNTSASTVDLSTFWFAWVPGKDFLVNNPTNITSGAGWTNDQVTHGAPPDGYAIRWVTTTASLAPGASLSGFDFTSADSPATLLGDSPAYPGTPILTSFVYQGGPFSGLSDDFQVKFASVPEPSTLTLGVVGLLATCTYAGFTRRRAKRLAAAV